MKMRGLMLISASFALTFAIITNAWLQKKQFYPTVVYLTKSSPCIAVLYVQAFVFVLLFAKLVRKIFFGQLRPAETEHLIERSWYAVTDTCLAFTMFRDDFSPLFVGAFTLLLFLKSFHWLLEDRVDFMERSPRITYIFKLRVLSLLLILLLCDVSIVNLSYSSIMTKGPSVQIVFGFEYAILVTIVLTVFLKYVLHTIDLQSENPWENKVLYMLYVEIVTGFLRVLLYICFTILMVKVHTFPLFSIRPMYLTMRQFKKAVSDIVLSRRAIQNMNNLYPDATAEELSNADSTCIICREEMRPSGDTPAARGVSDVGVNKKLPCGHIFHASCLRSWFQRQQTCPTCRLDVLQTRNPTAPGSEQRPPAAPNAAANIPPAPFAGQIFPPGQPPMFPGFPPPAPSGVSTGDNQAGTSSASSPQFAFPTPPFPTMMGVPSFYPPPVPPPGLGDLSDEQLREMEGLERRNMEARIECLRNINLLLDAAMMQISHYMQAAPNSTASLNLPPFPLTSTAKVNKSTSSSPGNAETVGAGSSNQSDQVDPTCSGGDAEQSSDSASLAPNADELRRRRLAKLSGTNGGSAEVS